MHLDKLFTIILVVSMMALVQNIDTTISKSDVKIIPNLLLLPLQNVKSFDLESSLFGFLAKINESNIIPNAYADSLPTIVITSPINTANTVTSTILVGTQPFAAALNPSTDTIYTANYGSNSVSVINGTTNNVTSTISVGNNPQGVAVNPSTNIIYVTNSGSNTVSVINGTTNTIIGSPISVGSAPVGIALDPSTNTIYVANYFSNTVSVINGTTNTVTNTIFVDSNPHSVAINPSTHVVYVTNSGDDTISVINGTTNTVKTGVSTGAVPRGIAFNPVTNTVYAVNYNSNTVTVINGTTNTIIGSPISVGTNPYAVAVNPSTNTIYVDNAISNTISVIDGTTNTVTDTVSVGNTPYGIVANPSNSVIYVANQVSNSISVINGMISISGNGITVTGTASDTGSSVSSVSWKIDSGSVSAATGTTSWHFTTPELSNGPHTIFVNATDVAGNVARTSQLITVDAIPPTIAITSPTNGTISFPSITITGTASDVGSGVANVQLSIDNGAYFLASGTTSWSVTINELSIGDHTVIAKATDSAGNVGFSYGTNIVIGNPIPVGTIPTSVAFDSANGNLYVANAASNTVSVINGTSNTVIGSPISVGSNPTSIAFDSANGNLYVANANSNTVSVINGTSNTVIGSPISVGTNPFGIAFDSANGNLYVTNNADNTVSVINGTSNTVIGSPISVGLAPYGIAFDSANGNLYVANYGGTVSVINGTSNTVIGSPIPVGLLTHSIAFDSANGNLYVTNYGANTVSVINGTLNRVIGSPISVGTNPYGIAFDSANGNLYVANAGSNTLSVISTPTFFTVVPPQQCPLGSDSFGYTCKDSNNVGGPTYHWIDINSTGTAVLAGADDDYLSKIPIGFNFSYYGVLHNKLAISSNGQIFFGAPSASLENVAIPDPSPPNNFVAPFWTDLINDKPGGQITYQTLGIAPNRSFVIEYSNVAHCCGEGSLGATFEVILNETSNNIKLQYQNATFNTTDDNGASATVGIESPSGSDGLQYSFNQPVLSPNLAVQFTYPQSAPPPLVNADLEIINELNSLTFPGRIINGSTFNYTITVNNYGPATATNVVVNDTLPQHLTFDNVNATCQNHSGNVTCNLGDMLDGAQKIIELQVTADPSFIGFVTNNATVSSHTTDNNDFDKISSVLTEIKTPAADLGIFKEVNFNTVNGGIVTNGSAFNYTITVHNYGPATATNVVVNDTLPAPLTFDNANATCQNNSGNITCSMGDMPSGNEKKIELQVTVNSSFTGDLINNAYVSSNTLDENDDFGPNTASVQTTVSQTGASDFVLFGTRPVNATQGNLGASNVILGSISGFNANVTLALQNLPSGVTGTFARNPLNMIHGFNETGFTLHLAPTVLPGTYSFVVNATTGLISHNTTMSLNVFPHAGVTPSAASGILYGTDASSHHLLTISKITGQGTIVGSFGNGSYAALAIDPTTGMMYLGQSGGVPYLYRVNPSNGAKTFVGDTGLGFAAIADMAFRKDGTLFAVVNTAGDGGSGADHLVTINKTSGVATVVGPFGACTGVFIPSSAEGSCTLEGIEGIAFNSTGTLYGSSSSRLGTQIPSLFVLNTTTGAATQIAHILNSTGHPPSGGVVSLTFNGNTLYGGTSRFNSTQDGGYLITINPVTGLFTKIGRSTTSSLGALALFSPSSSFSKSLSDSVGISDSLSARKMGPGPSITKLVALDQTGINTGYGNGLTITATFSEGTNQPGGLGVQNKTSVDKIFAFSQNLGANYTGQWRDTANFVITIRNSTGATPPAIGVLTFTVKASANLLNLAGTSSPSVSQSPPLTGSFTSRPGPFITSLTINDPSGQHPAYSNNDTITIRFSEPTNRPLGTGLLNKGDVDSLFTFTENLGNVYTGRWIDASDFVITIVNSTGSSPPVIGVTTATVNGAANLKNSIGTSLSSTSTSPALSGHFGNRPGPFITDLVASDPTGTHGAYSNGVTITVRFSEPTNTFDPTPLAPGLSFSDLNTMFSFSQNLGNNYNGQWVDPSTLVITIADSRGSTPPAIGVLQVTVVGNIKDASGTSARSTSISPFLSGSFGNRAGPSITSLVASDPTVSDAIYSTGDTITVTFSEATNRAGGTGILDKHGVDSLFNFTQNNLPAILGTSPTAYSGQWTDPSTFVITILDPTGSTPPAIGGLVTTVKSSANLKNLAGTSAASVSISPLLTGSFGDRPGPFITSLAASDPTGTHGTYSNGITITARFSEPTNQPGGTAIQSKVSIDGLFAFSQNLGNNYNGQWTDPSTFIITILDSTGSQPPTIGGLTATVKASANLKNAPGISLPSTSTSPLLSGSFGTRQGPFITNLIADDPTETHNSYASDITITAVFSEPTNKPGGIAIQNKNNVDHIFTFSQGLGANYTGQWVTSSTFVITIKNATGATPPAIGVLSATVNSGANLKNAAGTSLPSTSTSPLLAGTFGTFAVSIPVTDGGSAVATLPSGITTTLTLPSGSEGTIDITKSNGTTQTTNGTTIGFLGNIANITPHDGASCSAECTISFTFTQADADAFHIKPLDVKVFHDANEDGIFESNETLPTVVTKTGTERFTATAHASFNSKFAIGGIVPALAILGAIGGGGGYSAPVFSGPAFAADEFPLSIDGENFKLDHSSNTIPTVTLQTGKDAKINLEIYESQGPQYMQHVALYTDLRGSNVDVYHSDTSIIYEKGQPLQVTDPNGIFSSTSVSTSVVNDKFDISFDIVFAKPMKKSDIIIRSWDLNLDTSDDTILDAIQVQGNSIAPQPAPNALVNIPKTKQTQHQESLNIPYWVKNNAKWWSDGKIGDSDFTKGIQYLIQQKIMVIPETTAGLTHSQQIPSWIKNNAGWWANDQITDNDFVKGIQYLITQGIIKISG